MNEIKKTILLVIFSLGCSTHLVNAQTIKYKTIEKANFSEFSNSEKWGCENIPSYIKMDNECITSNIVPLKSDSEKYKKDTGSLTFSNKKWNLNIGETLCLELESGSGFFIYPQRVISLLIGNEKVSLFKEQKDFCVGVAGVNSMVYLGQLRIVKPNYRFNSIIYVERLTKNKFRWYLDGYGIRRGDETDEMLYYGDFEIKDAKKQLSVGFTVPTSFNKMLTIKEFSKGTIVNELPSDAIKPVILPVEAEAYKVNIRYDSKGLEGVDALTLNSTEGKVTKEELNNLSTYLIKRPLLTTNDTNVIFASWTKAYMMDWVYEQTHNLSLINRLIDQSRTLLTYRDDKYGKYKVKVTNDKAMFTKGWMHFSGMTYINGEVARDNMGISCQGAALNFFAAAALAIAKDKTIWDKTYQGVTYKQIAFELLDNVHETWDFVIEHYHDKKTNLLISPSYGEETVGAVPQWNRVFPLMAAGNSVVDAYEIMGVDNKKADKIDSILKSMFKEFWKYSRTVEINDKKCLLYPYGIYLLENNPNHTEDFGHVGFDARGFRVFSESGRYWKPEDSQLIANTLSQSMIKDSEGTVTSNMNGTSTMKNYNYWGSLPPMLWFVEFDEELEHKLMDYTVCWFDE